MEYRMEELLPVVKWLSEKYTGKASTSITYEKAEQLMGAALYCIREERMWEREKGEGIALLENRPVMEVYSKGYERVIQKVYRTKEVYEALLEIFDAYGCRCYYDTVVKGIPEFFIHYDPRFAPGDHILTLDYPVEGLPAGLCGVDLIYEYVKAILYEQKALGTIPRREVIEGLKDYHWNYEQLFINLYSVLRKE